MARSFDRGMRRSTCAWACLSAAAWLTAAGCSENDMASSTAADYDENGGIFAPPSGGAAASGNILNPSGMGGAMGTGTAITTPEVEAKVEFEQPQSSENYVYATSPERDSVAVIHASSLAIQVVETGDEPRFLKTIPHRDAAMLVDVRSNDLAYIETTNGQSVVTYFQDLPAANVIAVAPDGKHAVAYFDSDRMQEGRSDSLQDVSVFTLDTAGPTPTRMTVGYKSREVTFAGGTTGASAAYVVTEDGISILDFAEIDAQKRSGIARTVPVFSATEPKGDDISVTPDGGFALGRIEGTSKLRLIDLASGQARTLDIARLFAAAPANSGAGGSNGAGGAASAGTAGSGPVDAAGATVAAGTAGVAGRSAAAGAAGVTAATGGAPAVVSLPPVEVTDLDVSPDGKFALAIARNRGALVRVPIPEGFTDPAANTLLQVEGVIVGSAAISPNGRWAVLYTTAVLSERRIVIVDLSGVVAPRVLDLSKTIKGVAFSSSGDQAFVAHDRVNKSPTEPGISADEFIERSFAYTLVDLPKAFRKLQLTDAAPNLSITTPGAPYVFLTFQNNSQKVQRLDMESLQIRELELGSVPISLGVVPAAKRVFIGQNYTEGRLTFVDWETLDTKTVTGYELNSKIRE